MRIILTAEDILVIAVMIKDRKYIEGTTSRCRSCPFETTNSKEKQRERYFFAYKNIKYCYNKIFGSMYEFLKSLIELFR